MRGILFKPDIWQAKLKVLEEFGTAQTRRLDGLKKINQEPDKWALLGAYQSISDGSTYFVFSRVIRMAEISPRYQVGETVYVKEAWCEDYYGQKIYYKSDGGESPGPKGFWRSPLFMPAWAARYLITILDVKAERLQEITEEDCIGEGCPHALITLAEVPMQEWYHHLWNSTNKDYPWENNPWVEAYRFKMAEKQESNNEV